MSSPSGSSPTLVSPRLIAENAPSPSLARRAVLATLAPMTRARLRVELPEGGSREFGAPVPADNEQAEPAATIRVRREAFFRKCLWAGDIGFAESYLDADWDTPDLVATIGFFIRNAEQAPTLSGSRRRSATALNLLRFFNRVGHVLRPNTRATARRNISEHYDLSNEFFALWLDPSMMYSSARWPAHAPHLTLEEAQREKNEALCRSLRLNPRDHVLEIGTGWGGWSLHAARQHGVRVTTVTLSRQQFELARQRVIDAGLAGRVEVQLRDFREVRGSYDKIVSIEMVEALGHRFQPTFAEAVGRLLKPHGLLALQYINCPDSRYRDLRRGVDFIQKHIFPGSLLLSTNRFNHLLSRHAGLMLQAHEDFGPDYGRTLKLWREAFLARLDDVRSLGFDDRFIRKWTYYLAYCEAAFALRHISVVHTLHSRPNNPTL